MNNFFTVKIYAFFLNGVSSNTLTLCLREKYKLKKDN